MIKRKIDADVTTQVVATHQVASESSAVHVRELEIAGSNGALAARLYTSPKPAAKPGLIVFFHHGGFVTGDLDEAEDFVQSLAARTGFLILSSTYTLADKSPFPAAAEDAHAVLGWAVKHAASIGWNGKTLVTAGIEAGGNLAAVSALMARDRGGPAIAAQILIMPMLDPGLNSCSMRTLTPDAGTADVASACAAGYRGYLPHAADRSHPYASPLQSSRMKNLPAALILSAETDPLRDEAEQYGGKLIAAGTKTMVKRLTAERLQDPGARCQCVTQVSALNEIAAFIDGLDNTA